MDKEASYSERKYFARSLTSFSSDTLCQFVSLLREIDPDQFGVRKGGESFHVDFNALPEDTYVRVRKFIASHLPLDPMDGEEEPVGLTATTTTTATAMAEEEDKTSSRFFNGIRRFRAERDQSFAVSGFGITLMGIGVVTDRPYVCETCRASFVSKNKCVDHIRYIHLKEFQVECDVCHAQLKNRHYLKDHKKRMHTGRVAKPAIPVGTAAAAAKISGNGEMCRCKKKCGTRCGCVKSGRGCGKHCLCVECDNRTAVVAFV
ncbi:hypothetical protein BASA81_002997 [Batrachochytrium salamandrivorans]|nr:hypothetical protein BASA81_002997 [Batrachochytrium salamandrivorans]